MTEDNDASSPKRTLPSKRFVAFLYVPLMAPAALPLYFAIGEEDPLLLAIMIGTTIAVLLFNAVMLVGVYRMFAQGVES